MKMWRDVKAQERMWSGGAYDYLKTDFVTIKFNLCHFFINRVCKKPLRVLDVAGGTGAILPLIKSDVKLYMYNDVSKTAAKQFICSYSALLDSSVRINVGRIEDCNFEHYTFNVILILGLVKGLFVDSFLKGMVEERLEMDGILLVDMNDVEFSYAVSVFGSPTFKLDYQLWHDGGTRYVYKRKLLAFSKLCCKK